MSMYGTVAQMRVQPGRVEDLLHQLAQFEEIEVPGYIDTYVFQMDEDPNELFMAVAFADRESYQKNAEDPEQDRRYQAMRQLLVADPEWHDGEIVWTTEE